MIKTGIGYDVHQLVEGRRLVIGGIEIPATFGSLGHSDGDVLLHAIVDALLGAAALGDIGTLFLSEDQQWKDADSRLFLRTAGDKIRAASFSINNIDGIIVLQKPKLKDYIDAMRQVIAAELVIDKNCVSVKATTTEKLGFTGRQEGIAVHAVVLVEQDK